MIVNMFKSRKEWLSRRLMGCCFFEEETQRTGLGFERKSWKKFSKKKMWSLKEQEVSV